MEWQYSGRSLKIKKIEKFPLTFYSKSLLKGEMAYSEGVSYWAS